MHVEVQINLMRTKANAERDEMDEFLTMGIGLETYEA